MSLSNKTSLFTDIKNEKNNNIINKISNSENNDSTYKNVNKPNKILSQMNSIFNSNKLQKNINQEKITIIKAHSKKNILNSNNQNNSNIDSPIKIQNNMKTLDYSTTNDLKYERIISGKSIKSQKGYSPNRKSNIYKNNSLNFEPFSSKRILTIPTQNNHFGYAIDDNGETDLLDDPQMDEKFNGTKNNSIGPDRYNIIVSPRKRFIIDWSKLSEDKKIAKSCDKKKISEIKELKELDDFYLNSDIIEEKNDINDNYSVLSNNKSNSIDANNIRNRIFNKKNNIGYKSDDYINLTLLNYKMQKNEVESKRGPGSYNFSDEFSINPKRNKYQNFGSSVSRDLLYSPLRKKNNSIDNYIKYSFFANKDFNDNMNNFSKKLKIENSKILKTSGFFRQKVKAEKIKEKNIKNKKDLIDKLGPGTYNPEIPRISNSIGVENFGTLEKRKLTTGKKDSIEPVSYLGLEDWTKKNNYNFKTIETESVGEKYKLDLLNNKSLFNSNKENGVKNYIKDAYYKRSIDYDNKVVSSLNRNWPGFGSCESRFHIPESQINELNGVGKYNLIYPLKKSKQRLSPFLSSSSRDIITRNNNENVGPGSYNKNDTFFDWNKKSYNVQIKNILLDKYKNFKN